MYAQGRVLSASILVGIVAGLGAVVFSVACNLVVHYTLFAVAGYEEHGPKHEARVPFLHDFSPSFNPWLILLIAPIGGLISGYFVFRFAPEAEGHGTDAAIDAYHRKQGYIRPQVPPIKIIASAVTIGTGGSGGREGPIAQVGAGFGSFLGRLLKLRPAERRILMAAGIGAGIAAIFRAPLAGALFAAEVMYRSPEFEADVIIPASIASVVSYCTFGAFFDWTPLFATPHWTFLHPIELLSYTGLGIFMAVMAMIYTRTFYGITHVFRRIPISPYFKPAIGAFLSAGVGVGLYMTWSLIWGVEQRFLLSVLSFGYGVLQEGFLHELSISATVLIAIALGKILTTSLTIGSGGSGGVFGPSMVIGGCAGAAFGIILHRISPALVPHPATFMIVGMAGFFAAAGKVPLSTLVIVSEMTGDYLLLLPALWVCAISYLLSDEQSLYQSQVDNSSLSPAHKGEYVREVLTGLSVNQFVKADSAKIFVKPDDNLATAIDKLSQSPYSVLPVVDDEHRLLGVVVLEEIYLASRSPNMSQWILVADLMRSAIKPLRPVHSLDRAHEIFVQNDLYALPIVDDNQKVIGIVKRSDLARIYLRHVHGPISEDQPSVVF